MAIITLKAEVLHQSNGCPICGGEKTKRAKTCAKCRKEHGAVVTDAVDKIAETIETAKAGHEAALEGGTKRDIAFGLILAQVKIDKNAVSHLSNGTVQGYWECKRMIDGGFVSLFVFGTALEPGKVYTAMIELKTKQPRPGCTVHYLRAEVVPDGIRSDMKLAVVPAIEATKLSSNLPSMKVREERRSCAIGFLPVNPPPKPEEKATIVEQPTAN
jgi:hypothetical protein